MARRGGGIDLAALALAGAVGYVLYRSGLLNDVGAKLNPAAACLADSEQMAANAWIINDMEAFAQQHAPFDPRQGWEAFRARQRQAGRPDPGTCPHSLWIDLSQGRIPVG